ncbi:hypothetical protein BJ165DRAFT_1405682 [Panaeolus papilionaceus]|nr:hypothetical protein BJ165DRAFT_1405682 [Panaeolus papilionaceus]
MLSWWGEDGGGEERVRMSVEVESFEMLKVKFNLRQQHHDHEISLFNICLIPFSLSSTISYPTHPTHPILNVVFQTLNFTCINAPELTTLWTVSHTPVHASPSHHLGNLYGHLRVSGLIQCCKQVMDLESASFTGLASVLDIDLAAFSGPVGLGCSPIIVFGSDSSCNGQAVCCSSEKYDGLLHLGCIPAIVA